MNFGKNFYDSKLYEYECFRCGECNKFEIDNSSIGKTIVFRENTIKVNPTYIEKNKVEVEYKCTRCSCKNKIVVNL